MPFWKLRIYKLQNQRTKSTSGWGWAEVGASTCTIFGFNDVNELLAGVASFLGGLDALTVDGNLNKTKRQMWATVVVLTDFLFIMSRSRQGKI